MVDTRVKKIPPRAEAFLRYVHENLLFNRRLEKDARLVLPPLVSRAYNIVYEVQSLKVRELDRSPLFRKRTG